MRRMRKFHSGEAVAHMHGVSKSFGDKPIIKDISLRVNQGETLLITGQSGSGKSTLLRSIAGLERPDNGSVQLFGENLYKLSDKDRARWISHYVGVGFQAHNLDTGFSTLDNLESLAEAKGKVDRRRLGRVAVSLGLQDKLFQPASSLSGGEKQRVALGRLLVPQPELVLLDEPTAAIDPSGKRQIYEALRDFNREEGTTFVIVSHDDIAREYADREVVVESGLIIADRPLHPFSPAA